MFGAFVNKGTASVFPGFVFLPSSVFFKLIVTGPLNTHLTKTQGEGTCMSRCGAESVSSSGDQWLLRHHPIQADPDPGADQFSAKP